MPVLEDELSRVKSDDDPAFGKDVKAPRPRIALKGTFGHHHVPAPAAARGAEGRNLLDSVQSMVVNL